MRSVRSLVVALLVSVVLAAPAVVLADDRVALVVGNSTYAHIGRLPNPQDDAADMSVLLQRLGFEVTTELDTDRAELTEALRSRWCSTRATVSRWTASTTWSRRCAPGTRRGRALRDGDGRRPAGVDHGRVVTAGDPGCVPEQPAGALDAAYGCYPYGERGQLRRPERGPAGGRDTGGVCGGGGDDGGGRAGRDSPYTAALLSHLETPLEIGLLFRRVRAQVLASTNGAQRPHEYHSLVGEHYLTRTLATGAAVTVSAAVPADPASADPPRPDPAEVDVTELPIAALRELAEAGDAEAQTELGERYEHGHGVEQDYGVAVSWFRQAAERGHASGQAALGFLYATGHGVVQDFAEALRWFRRSADQGHARGQDNLGMMYRDGLEVAQDYGEALRCAAEQGSAIAQNNLGVSYRDGRGVRQDDAQAVRWFRRAAEQGNALAQNNLGWSLENGLGVRRDRVEAVRWYRLAAEQGNANAQKALDRLR